MQYWLLVFFCGICNGLNILVVTPNSMRSESQLVINIADTLVKAGHNVTFITGYKGSNQHKNLTVIWFEEIQQLQDHIIMAPSLEVSPLEFYSTASDWFKTLNEIVWNDKRVMDVWERRKEFDLLVTLSLLSEGGYPFLMDNDMPLVQLVTMGADSHPLSVEGNWITPSILPSMFVSYPYEMNFWERSVNLLSTVMVYYILNHKAISHIEPVVEKFPNMGDIKSYGDRLALTLINGHFTMDGPLPYLPNQIEIGGFNIKKTKPLDEKLSAFIEGSGEAGIIYFSLGTIARSSLMSKKEKNIILEAFRKLPQRIVWKYEDTDLEVPPNVMIKKWMPQQDILAHPKTKVFISHCGKFGTQEAMYFGVPILGLPVMMDQHRNAAKIVRQGYALSLLWKELNTDDIVNSLNKLVNDTSFRENMQRLSRTLQDQKESPQERTIWWLEYVARHKGTSHLQYAGKRLSFFQYIMLDVLLVWFSIFSIIVFGFVFLIKMICFRSKNSSTKNKDKKNQ